MCGISGILHLKAITSDDHIQVDQMLSTIAHRGPDGKGIYIESPDICFGSVRLAMVDSLQEIYWLSNENNSLFLVFNGEIYNHKQLRKSLENQGHCFKTQSDGETILHLYEDLNFALLDQLDGMFAFALWDSHRKILLLARDPCGIKPLYYKIDKNRFIFASELKALTTLSTKTPEIDPLALSSYFHYRFVAPPRTIFQNISKLEPGSFLIVQDQSIQVHSYWQPTFQKRRKIEIPFDEIWKEAVETTASSDHQLGIFLSGGLDSGGILAILSETQPSVSAFTIGYDCNYSGDEGIFASKIANFFGSKHKYQQIKISEVAQDLEKVIWHLEEPLYSTVSLSTYRLAKMASQHVKGVLTGDGADELLLGYPYLLKASDAFLGGGDWKKAYLYQIGWLTGNWAEKLLTPDLLLKEDLLQKSLSQHPFDAIRYFEIKYRLSEYHLARMDRLSMACGLEARVPFLRKKIVECFLNHPSDFLLVPGKQKEILKNSFFKLLPQGFIERKKQSFTAPFIQWLQGPLKEEAHDLILGTDYPGILQLKKAGLQEMMDNCYHGDGSAFSVLWGVFIICKWYKGSRK